MKEGADCLAILFRIEHRDRAAKKPTAPAKAERHGCEVAGTQKMLMVHRDTGEITFSCGPWKNWFEICDRKIRLFAANHLRYKLNNPREFPQIWDSRQYRTYIINFMVVVGKEEARKSADTDPRVSFVTFLKCFVSIASGQQYEPMARKHLDDRLDSCGMATTFSAHAVYNFCHGHSILSS